LAWAFFMNNPGELTAFWIYAIISALFWESES
jgi:hypothetical protein